MKYSNHWGPVIAVTGLSFEARIAIGEGVTVLCGGGPQHLAASLQGAITTGASGIISLGTAGGLAPDLAPGDWVVAAGVLADGRRYPTDPLWSRVLVDALKGRHGDVIGVDEPVAAVDAKRDLHARTGAPAVDMESHIAARVAAEHELPFATARVVIDPAERSLPSSALAGRRADGRSDAAAVIRALMRRPGQLPALLRLALDARAARASLLRGRRLLGAGLGLPNFGKLRLDLP